MAAVMTLMTVTRVKVMRTFDEASADHADDGDNDDDDDDTVDDDQLQRWMSQCRGRRRPPQLGTAATHHTPGDVGVDDEGDGDGGDGDGDGDDGVDDDGDGLGDDDILRRRPG